jgi:hypothetical protein
MTLHNLGLNAFIMKTELTYICSADYQGYRDNLIEFRERINGTAPVRFFDSFYTGNPCGEPLFGLCFDSGKLVGQENYIRQDVVRGGKKCRGAMGINTLVDPGYRLFHGVFGRLCSLTMDALAAKVDMLFAFANEESKKYYLKYFQWDVASKIGVYKKATGFSGPFPEKILALLCPGRLTKEISLLQVDQFDPSLLNPLLERYLERATHSYFYKSAEYLNWKFLRNSHYAVKGFYVRHSGKIRGYCLTYDDGTERKLLDFIIDSDDADIFTMMLDTLAWQARKDDKQRLVAFATPGCWYESLLKRRLFIKRWDFDFIIHNFASQESGEQWVAHAGDFDMF